MTVLFETGPGGVDYHVLKNGVIVSSANSLTPNKQQNVPKSMLINCQMGSLNKDFFESAYEW